MRRRGFEAGFRGPRVLVPRGVAAAGPGGQRLRAAYVEGPMTFRHIIQAVAVPPGDERRGKLLAGLLNSRLMLWFAFHGHFVIRLGATGGTTEGTSAPSVSCPGRHAGSRAISLGSGCAGHHGRAAGSVERSVL